MIKIVFENCATSRYIMDLNNGKMAYFTLFVFCYIIVTIESV